MSQNESHGSILVDTGDVSAASTRGALPPYQPSPTMHTYGRFLATIYAGAGLVSLAVYWVFQTAP